MREDYKQNASRTYLATLVEAFQVVLFCLIEETGQRKLNGMQRFEALPKGLEITVLLAEARELASGADEEWSLVGGKALRVE